MKLYALLSTYVFTVLLQLSGAGRKYHRFLSAHLKVDFQNSNHWKFGRFHKIETMIDLSTNRFYFFEDSTTLRFQYDDSIYGFPINFLYFLNDHPVEVSFNRTCKSIYQNADDLCVHLNKRRTSFLLKGYCCPQTLKVRCIRYGPSWYSINFLGKPLRVQNLIVDVFERHGRFNRGFKKSLAKTSRLLVNGQIIQKRDNRVDLTASILQENNFSCSNDICLQLHYLLIPVAKSIKKDFIAERSVADMKEYLYIRKKNLQSTHVSCGSTGIPVGAVLRKNDSCSDLIKDSCSKSIYERYFQKYHPSQILTRKSNFSLTHFAELVFPYVGKIPGWKAGKTLLFTENNEHSTEARLNILINIDKDLFSKATPVVSKGSFRTLFSYPLSDYENKYEIGVTILNIGVIIGYFKLSINCKFDKQFKKLKLHPFQKKFMKFHFRFDFGEYTEKTCGLELWNENEETSLSKDITIVRDKTCLCLVGCQCSCGPDFECVVLKKLKPKPRHKVLTQKFAWIISYSLTLVMVLNLIKLFMGLCNPVSVGEAGLCVFIKSYRQKKYFEKELQHKAIEYNSCGYPVHPKTRVRVRGLSIFARCALNLIFFFYLPFIGIHWLLVRCKINKKQQDIMWEHLDSAVETNRLFGSIPLDMIRQTVCDPSCKQSLLPAETTEKEYPQQSNCNSQKEKKRCFKFRDMISSYFGTKQKRNVSDCHSDNQFNNMSCEYNQLSFCEYVTRDILSECSLASETRHSDVNKHHRALKTMGDA